MGLVIQREVGEAGGRQPGIKGSIHIILASHTYYKYYFYTRNTYDTY